MPQSFIRSLWKFEGVVIDNVKLIMLLFVVVGGIVVFLLILHQTRIPLVIFSEKRVILFPSASRLREYPKQEIRSIVAMRERHFRMAFIRYDLVLSKGDRIAMGLLDFKRGLGC